MQEEKRWWSRFEAYFEILLFLGVLIVGRSSWGCGTFSAIVSPPSFQATT
jgi:hypothetical protein